MQQNMRDFPFLLWKISCKKSERKSPATSWQYKQQLKVSSILTIREQKWHFLPQVNETGEGYVFVNNKIWDHIYMSTNIKAIVFGNVTPNMGAVLSS